MIRRAFLIWLFVLSGCGCTLHGPTVRTFADEPKIKDYYVGFDVAIPLDKPKPRGRL